jgi:hypothetical protein
MSPAEDLLRGVPAIAEYIGETERKTYYQCEKGLIPVGKLGATWIASKTKLRRHYDQLTDGGQ